MDRVDHRARPTSSWDAQRNGFSEYLGKVTPSFVALDRESYLIIVHETRGDFKHIEGFSAKDARGSYLAVALNIPCPRLLSPDEE